MTPEQEKRLGEPLDAKRIKQREGRGGGPALSYLETHDVIRTANSIFGFGEWGHEIVELRYLDGVAVTSKAGKPGIQVGYLCTVRLTVAGHQPVSGIGFGDAVEYTQSAPVTAHELAAKEAESDALKRALKNYGDQFGLALYDKQAKQAGHIATGNAASDRGRGAAAAPTPQASAVEGTDGKSSPATADAPRYLPSREEVSALLELVERKGGDKEATRTAANTAKANGNLAEWYPAQLANWTAAPEPSEFAKGAAKAQKTRAAA